MTISTISSVGQGHHHHGDGGPLKSVASLLGTSVSDLRTQLQSGKSLDDLAQAARVSHDDLIAAIKKGMPQRLQDSGRADQVAEQIATRTGEPARPAGAPPGVDQDGDHDAGHEAGRREGTGVFGASMTSAQSQMLTQLSSLLGTDSSSLMDSLKSGASLSDLLSQKGIGADQLAGVLQNGLLVDAKA